MAKRKHVHDTAPRVFRTHLLRHRARLRVAAPLDRAALVELAEILAAVPGIDRVLARPATGSLIVETHRPAAEVLDDMEDRHLIRSVKPPPRPPVRQSVQLGLAKADLGLRQRTDQALDIRTALGLLLLTGAILQLARGRVAGPATTLAIAALSLLSNGQDSD